jgi:hypothetical protein
LSVTLRGDYGDSELARICHACAKPLLMGKQKRYGPQQSRYHSRIGKPAKPENGICPKRRLLLGKLTSALEEVLTVYRQLQQVMAKADPRFRHFDKTLEKCTAKMQAARVTYWRHVKSHGC